MTEYEMTIKELRALIKKTRLDADECIEFDSLIMAERLRQQVIGIGQAIDIIEKVHKQFLEKVGNEK